MLLKLVLEKLILKKIKVQILIKNYVISTLKYVLEIVSTPNLLHSEAAVSQLIDQDTKWWNTSLIDQIFYPFEAEKIKSIPLCSFSQPNLLFWQSTSCGDYAIKSGYHLLCVEDDSELASVSDGVTSRFFWNSLWKNNVPNKVKSFMWRACTDSLPTLKKLVQKTIVSYPSCAVVLYKSKESLELRFPRASCCKSPVLFLC